MWTFDRAKGGRTTGAQNRLASRKGESNTWMDGWIETRREGSMARWSQRGKAVSMNRSADPWMGEQMDGFSFWGAH